MCYPKPGPRCSASAAARLARAKHAAFAYFTETRGTTNMVWEEYEKLAAATDEAQREYDITPAGIKVFERRVASNPTNEVYAHELARVKAERAARIQAAKAREEGDYHAAAEHQLPAPIAYSRTALSAEGERLHAIKQSSQDVQALLSESEAWVTKLTAGEIDALHWYSQGGYEDINGGLSNPAYEGRKRSDGTRPKGAPAETVALLDSALAKADASNEAVVYRRHFFYTDKPGGLFDNLTFEQQAAQFPVGSVYEPGFYMSTSLNPANIGMGGEGGFMVRLEIKTRRGAALVGVAQQGTGEQEILLPRTGAYRVVSNDRRVTVSDKGESREVRVIQLEELPAD